MSCQQRLVETPVALRMMKRMKAGQVIVRECMSTGREGVEMITRSSSTSQSSPSLFAWLLTPASPALATPADLPVGMEG